MKKWKIIKLITLIFRMSVKNEKNNSEIKSINLDLRGN